MSGTWTVAGGEMRTADSDAELFHQREADTPYVVTISIRGEHLGDQLRVLVGVSEDRSTYLYAQVTLGEGMSIAKQDGTVLASVVVPQLTAEEWHTLRVCLSFVTDQRITAVVTTASGVKRYTYYADVGSTYNQSSIGIGTGHVTLLASFDDFTWQRQQTENDPECPTCTVNCVYGSLVCEDTSDWEIVSGSWTCGTTNSADAILKLRTTQPENIHHHRVHGLISSTEDGGQVVFYVRYKDPTTYLAGRATFGDCGKLELIQNGAVIESLNVGPLTSENNRHEGTERLYPQHFFCVVYDGAYLSAHLGPGGGQSQSLSDQYEWLYRHVRASVTPDQDGIYAAIGTGANPGTITISDLFVSTPYSAQHPFCDTCFTCALTAGGIPDIPNQCEFTYHGSVRPLNDEYLEPIGVILSTVNSYAAYKGNVGADDAYLDVTFRGTVSGQVFRVYINNDGDTSGLWAEVEIKDDTRTIFRLSTGANIETTDPVRTGEEHQLLICLDGTSLIAMLDPGDPIGDAPGAAALYGIVSPPQTGRHVVFEQLGMNGDLYVISPYYARGTVPRHAGVSSGPVDCGRCLLECACCLGGRLPTEFVVDIRDIEFSNYIGSTFTGVGSPLAEVACGVAAVSYPAVRDPGRVCREIPGTYVVPFALPCIYEYASEVRTWKLNDEPTGGGDDFWYCWQLFIRAAICCTPTTDGTVGACATIGQCIDTPPGHFRVGVAIEMRAYGHTPTPGSPPCGVDPVFGNQPSLLSRHVSFYYSDPLPEGTDCFAFDELELRPLSWNIVDDPTCIGSSNDCNNCGVLVFNGPNRVGWTSAHSVYLSSL